MKSILLVLTVLAASLGWFYSVQFFRVKSMRALAGKLGFRFVDRPLPAYFTMDCDPFDGKPLVWNVIEGQRNGINVLVFDSIVRGGKGFYRTFVAVQTEGEPFPRDGTFSSGKILRSNGWTALYQNWYGLGQLVGWTMTVQRIEECITNLRI